MRPCVETRARRGEREARFLQRRIEFSLRALLGFGEHHLAAR
jgi:hypothetical protein